MTTRLTIPPDTTLGPVSRIDSSIGDIGDVLQLVDDGAGGQIWQPVSASGVISSVAKAPLLSYVYSGTNVIITATISGTITDVRFASALNTPPTDAAVLAGTADASSPYTYTVAAPTGTDVLYVGALVENGALVSDVSRKEIPPKPLADERTIQVPFGNGATMGSVGNWLAASPGWKFKVVRWKVRALKADKSQANIDITFSVKKVKESDGSLVDMIGGVLTLTGAAEANGAASGWTDPNGLENDEIIITIESMSNTNLVTSVLVTLTVERLS